MAPSETLDRRSAARIGAIVIARHGKPHADRKVRIDHHGYREWWAGYDRARLHPDEKPPEKLVKLAEASDVIYASTLPRAIPVEAMRGPTPNCQGEHGGNRCKRYSKAQVFGL